MITMRRLRLKLPNVLLVMLSLASVVRADPAPFDLAGPTVDVTVSRGSATLPISEVPNLASGDRLQIKAQLPATQSAQYLMVAAFLSGSTNPPPSSWFYRCKTWTRECATQGLSITVPADAQQVLVFLAPKTGGDFNTLVEAVRGRPGAFVRASQDLNQATLDRSRLQAYLSAIHGLNDSDQRRLKEVTPLLARSLAIKVDEKCLDRIPELQAPCLMQGDESLILSDGHSTSIVEALTSGPASDLAIAASDTPQLGYGYFSPYIASVFDIGRILASLHTAQYQYIPALASLSADHMLLSLNTPPSFHNPKSVLVIALPAVEHAQLPPLHAVNPRDMYCARKDSLVLPVEGAPLVFSTAYTHDVTLRLSGKSTPSIELPVRADAQQGGLVVNTDPLQHVTLGDNVQASLHGYWGFDSYDGPQFQLVNPHPGAWQLTSGDEEALIVGRQDTIHLTGASVSCMRDIMLRDAGGQELKADWKAVKPDEVELKLPLQTTQPGSITLLLNQYGSSASQPMQLQAFAEAAHLDQFDIHAGDAQGVLTGSRLDNVTGLAMKAVQFVPGTLSSHQGIDELAMIANDSQAVAALKPADAIKAKVTLKDGRILTLTAHVGSPRPRVTLIDKSVQPSSSTSASHIQITDPDELPQDAKLTFSLRAQSPAVFASDETIEVATADGSASTVLSFLNGGLTLANSHIAVATLDAVHPFGMSAFGPLQFRVSLKGVSGDWQPLATLVRLPVLTELTCPASSEVACKLSGSDLFLVDSISDDPQFIHSVQVPDGFPGFVLPVPQPTHGQLYVKLRDDPSVASAVAMNVISLPPSPDEATSAAAKFAAANTASSASAPKPSISEDKRTLDATESSGPETTISPSQPPSDPVPQSSPAAIAATTSPTASGSAANTQSAAAQSNGSLTEAASARNTGAPDGK
jgi:hypothetical protein